MQIVFCKVLKEGDCIVKNVMKRFASTMLVLVVAFGLVFSSVGEVKAASSEYVPLPSVMWIGEYSYLVSVYKMDSSKEYTVKKVTSSSSAVKIKKEKWDDKTYWLATPKKAGTATVKVTYKKSGKTKKISTKIKVKKYPNHIKSLKVNGKKINISKNKFTYTKRYKGTSAKIKMALKSGWKIKSVDGVYYKKDTNKSFKVKKSQIAKGSKISFPKKYESMDVWIRMVNKKGDVITYDVYLYR